MVNVKTRVCSRKKHRPITLFTFMREVIDQLQTLGRFRTSETYASTLKSIQVFRQGQDLYLDEITSDLMMGYEAYLKQRGLTRNSSSFYMRILRAVYNRAVEKAWVEQTFPFKHVYTGIDKTIKRAIPLSLIKKIKCLKLGNQPKLQFARDVFLFSFYTRGMSFVDMAYLRKTDLKYGILSYRRRKTGQVLYVKWEACMQQIMEHYSNPQSVYLLPLIDEGNGELRIQYKRNQSLINGCLKQVGELVGCPIPLTLYVARHSWASIAKDKNIPVAVISEGMGHDSLLTTQIYLASLDNSMVDKANALILNDLK